MSNPPDDSWEKTWDARLAALEREFGKSANNVFHAVMPFALGGQADVAVFPGFCGGIAYITSQLTGADVGQLPNELGEYELMICTRQESQRAAELIANLASYTCEAVLEPGESMDISEFFGDSSIRALLFCHPKEAPVAFDLNGRKSGVLLCVGITADELAFKLEHGSERLLEILKERSVFPFTVPDRESVPL